MSWKDILENFIKENPLIKGDIDYYITRFQVYMDQIIRWNKVINLTAIEKETDIVIKHFIDSLIPLRFINENDFIIDIGSGAGFPGLPIKIVMPSIKIVMIDARLKKINFINNVINLLDIKGATALHQRAEAKDFQKIMSESFDIAISRATFTTNELAELAKPYIKEKGKLIAMKSRTVEADETIEGFKQIEEFKTTLPDGSFRRILVFEKM